MKESTKSEEFEQSPISVEERAIFEVLSCGLVLADDFNRLVLKKLTPVDNELQRLEEQHISLRKQVGEKILDYRAFREDKEKAQCELDDYTDRHRRALEYNEKLKKILNVWTEKKKKLESQNEIEIRSYVGRDKWRKAKEEAAEQVEEADEQLSKMRPILRQLEGDVKNCTYYISQLEKTLSNTETEIDVLKDELSIVLKERNECESKIDSVAVKREDLQGMVDFLAKNRSILGKEYFDQKEVNLNLYYCLTPSGSARFVNRYEFDPDLIKKYARPTPQSRVHHETMVTEIVRTLRRQALEFKCEVTKILDDNSLRREARMENRKMKRYPDIHCKLTKGEENMEFVIEADNKTQQTNVVFGKVKDHDKPTLILCNTDNRIQSLIKAFNIKFRHIDKKEAARMKKKIVFGLHSDFIKDGLSGLFYFFSRKHYPSGLSKGDGFTKDYLEWVGKLPFLHSPS